MADTAVIIGALRRQVDKLGSDGAGKSWLEGIHQQALDAVLAGDREITSIAYEGGSSSMRSRVSSAHLLEACEAVLEELATKTPAGGDMILPQFGSIPR